MDPTDRFFGDNDREGGLVLLMFHRARDRDRDVEVCSFLHFV